MSKPEAGTPSPPAPGSAAKCEWWSGDKKSGFTTCQSIAAWQHVKHTRKGEQVWKLCEHHKRLLLDSYAPAWRVKEELEWTPILPSTGSRAEQAKELIRRCDARDANLEQRALEAERAGDQECCWMNMAARAENKRFRDRLVADLAAMGEHENTEVSERGPLTHKST